MPMNSSGTSKVPRDCQCGKRARSHVNNLPLLANRGLCVGVMPFTP